MASASANKIKFSSHFFLKKWGYPNLYGSGKLYQMIKQQSKLRHKIYRPHIAAYNPYVARRLKNHLEDKYKYSIALDYKRHIIQMVDGGVVSVDQVSTKDNINNISARLDLPNILLIPAGIGHAHLPFAKRRASWFLEYGFPKVFVCNPRGTSRTLLETPQCSLPIGRFNDIPGVIDHFELQDPSQQWLIVGNCWGSMVGINYFMNPHSYRDSVVGGIFDSFQWDVWKMLERQYDPLIFKHWTIAMMWKLVNIPLKGHANQEVYDSISRLIDREKFENLDFSKTACIKQVLENFLPNLCPGGFETSEEYHLKVYAGGKGVTNYMKIRKPVMLINACDDPFTQPFTMSDIEQIESNPNLALLLFPGGGHDCFVNSVYPYSQFHKDVILECASILYKM